MSTSSNKFDDVTLDHIEAIAEAVGLDPWDVTLSVAQASERARRATAVDGCPDWCETTEQQHRDDDPDCALHIGKVPGTPFSASLSVTNGRPGPILVDLSAPRDMTAADLWKLAADAVTAADWIKAQS